MIQHAAVRPRQSRQFWLFPVLAVGVSIVFAGAAFAFGAATEKNEHELKLKTERVIVFKDGYSLIVKRGSAVTDNEGEIRCDDVPDAAVLGSFWAVPSQGRLVSMLAAWQTLEEKVSKDVGCTRNIEVLQANRGKQCKVELSDKTTYSGVIRNVLLDGSTEAVPRQLRSAFSLPETAGEWDLISRVAASHFVLRTEDGDVLLPVSQLRTLKIHDMKTVVQRTVTTKKRTKRLTFRFEKPNQQRELYRARPIIEVCARGQLC